MKKINIAVVGLGNIGSYFVKTVLKNRNNIAKKTGKIPIIKYISAKNYLKKRTFNKITPYVSQSNNSYINFFHNYSGNLFMSGYPMFSLSW